MKVLAALLLIFSLSAHADFFKGPVSSSLGGAGRAGMDSAESAFLNPALIPLLKSYEINGYYRDGYVDEGQHSQSWGVGASDNSADVLIPGALHYMRLRETGRSARPAEGELWHIAVGKIAFENFSFGLSGYRLKYDLDGGTSSTQWNASVGALWMLSQELGVGYVLDNLANAGSDVPLGLREDVKQSIAGMMGIADVARLRADISRRERNNPGHDVIYGVGLESMSSEFVLVRLGYKKDDERDQTFYTAGIGFNGPRLKIDYTFEKNAERTSGALHSVDLRLPF